MERATAGISTASFLVSRIDQSHRQYRCDRESDQSYVEEWPWFAKLLVLRYLGVKSLKIKSRMIHPTL